MTPKEFIQRQLIDEIGEIHRTHPYASFALMAIGIEFLGKCLNGQADWQVSSRAKIDFELAINSLSPFQKYASYLQSHDLWKSLRNGLTHAFLPKSSITLSSGSELGNLVQHSSKVNLRCEDFYNDFKLSCLEVINKTFPTNDKMTLPILIVPDSTGMISYSGAT